MRNTRAATARLRSRAMRPGVSRGLSDQRSHFEPQVTMSREGIFMLRNVHVEPTTDKDADYVSWWTTFTFSFSSSDEVLNSYKEFGFGDVH